jgi:Tfp pilus assembly protein PilZ
MRSLSTIERLLEEFAALNEARRQSGEKLGSESEARWAELKVFYELVMSHNGLAPDRPVLAYSNQVPRRVVRVPTDLTCLVRHRGRDHQARALNANPLGLFVASDEIYDVGTAVTLVLGREGSGEPPLAVEGEVVWSTEGFEWSSLPRGMGIRWVDFPPETEDRLDSLLTERLERGLGVSAL